MIYGFVAYKPDGIESAKGCTIDSWSSDLICFSSDLRPEVVKKLSDIYIKDAKMKQGSYDVEIMINGLTILSEGYSDFIASDENCNFEEFESEAYDLRSDARNMADQLLKLDREAEAKAKEEKEALSKKNLEKAERIKYEELKKKYG